MSTAIDTVQQESSSLSAAVAALQVTDTASYQEAAAWLTKIKGHLKKIADVFDPILRSQREALDTTRSQRATLEQPAKDAEVALKKALGAYEQGERDRAEAERRRVAEEQRQRQTEADRIAREGTASREEEAALARALDAEAQGVAVEEVPAAPVVPVIALPQFVPPAVVAAPPKAEGVSFREDWDFELVDVLLVPLEYLIVDEVKVRRVVRALKSTTSIPGIRAFSKRIVSSRAS